MGRRSVRPPLFGKAEPLPQKVVKPAVVVAVWPRLHHAGEEGAALANPGVEAIPGRLSAADGQLSTLRVGPLDPSPSPVPVIRHRLAALASAVVVGRPLLSAGPARIHFTRDRADA